MINCLLTGRHGSRLVSFLFYLCIMSNVNFKIKGIEALQNKLKNAKEIIEKRLETELRQVAEEAVTHAKLNKGYHDRTANLKNSISYALFKDGELVGRNIGTIPKPNEDSGGQEQVEDNLMVYAKADGVVKASGYTVIVVAGMNYGAHVEHKGYNVLYLTGSYLREEIMKVMENIIEDIKHA